MTARVKPGDLSMQDYHSDEEFPEKRHRGAVFGEESGAAIFQGVVDTRNELHREASGELCPSCDGAVDTLGYCRCFKG